MAETTIRARLELIPTGISVGGSLGGGVVSNKRLEESQISANRTISGIIKQGIMALVTFFIGGKFASFFKDILSIGKTLLGGGGVAGAGTGIGGALKSVFGKGWDFLKTAGGALFGTLLPAIGRAVVSFASGAAGAFLVKLNPILTTIYASLMGWRAARESGKAFEGMGKNVGVHSQKVGDQLKRIYEDDVIGKFGTAQSKARVETERLVEREKGVADVLAAVDSATAMIPAATRNMHSAFLNASLGANIMAKKFIAAGATAEEAANYVKYATQGAISGFKGSAGTREELGRTYTAREGGGFNTQMLSVQAMENVVRTYQNGQLVSAGKSSKAVQQMAYNQIVERGIRDIARKSQGSKVKK